MTTATPMTFQDGAYLKATFQQYVDTVGENITYNVATVTGRDSSYNQPVITYTANQIRAIVTDLTNAEYAFVEKGFLPTNYAVVWMYSLTPQVGDHVEWHGIEWEVRNSIPYAIGGQTVYFQTIIRRGLAGGSLGSGS